MNQETQPSTTTQVPLATYQNNLANPTPQPVRWLWPQHLPLAGITLLDGDHGCGKSLLALEIAAHVSSGTPMPDGTPVIQGGVVIITTNINPTSQLQLLASLGADLSRVEILSFIQEPEPASESHPSSSHPFSLPDDLPHLFNAIKRVDARLVVLDPFITLLSRKQRCTNERLCHLLIDLNHQLIEHNVACLLIRACPAKGGHARPSTLEKSDYFITIAVSRLLLTPDPFQPNHLLLSQAKSHHGTITPTLTLQILSQPSNYPHITIQSTHSLQATDLMEFRPDTLHRQLLSHRILELITKATDHVPATTLYALLPHCSIFQIHRSLKDLLNSNMIRRTGRGLYTTIIITPASPLNTTPTTNPTPQTARSLNTTPATNLSPQTTHSPNTTLAANHSPQSANKLNTTPAITSDPKPASKLNTTPAITSDPKPASKLNTTPAITSDPKPASPPDTTPTTPPRSASITTQSLRWITS